MDLSTANHWAMSSLFYEYIFRIVRLLSMAEEKWNAKEEEEEEKLIKVV